MIGQPLADAFGCGQIDEIVRGTSAALKGETEQFECVWADKMYEAEVRPIVDADGSVTGAFGVALDVTERNESTDRLRRLAAVIDAADDAIVAIGSDGRIRSWNRGAEELFGYRQAAVVGQPLADLFVERDDVLSNLERVLAGDHIVARVMVRTPRSDQRPRRISATLSPIKNGAGRAIGVAAIIRAQRDEIAAQTHLLQAQKVEAISRLASGVAHDFNNLLTVLQVYGELLRNQLPPHWPAQEDLTVIMNATRSAADMTRELLAFSRGEAAGKPEI
jgi:PAS domain S-box-containing protein